MQCKFKMVITAALLISSVISASAITTVAGISFQDDNAFADTVVSSSGIYALAGAATLPAAVTGSSLGKYAYSFSTGAYLQMGFTDNYLVNGIGADLALFEIGLPDSFAVTINGTTLDYLSSATGYTGTGVTSGKEINVAEIDLSDFGIALGTQLSSIMIGMDVLGNNGTTEPSLSVAGALNSAPVNQAVPDAGSTISLLGTALLSFGLLKRKF